MKDHIRKEAKVCMDLWSGYKGLDADYPNITLEKSKKKGKNFKEMHWTIIIFKAWLRGIHHTVRNLQIYIDE